MTKVCVTFDTPLGPVTVAGRAGQVTDICLPGAEVGAAWRADGAAFPAAQAQLTAYFDGLAPLFDFAIAPEGSGFQRQVWAALRAIPYGQTATYAQIAAAVGKPGGTQAVGQANGRNPCPIVIPCHRVVAADGGLGGFSGGADLKRQLLVLEGAREEAPRLL
ncbi:MAG: methylated-DNA--[protein]-cysteine S-methyltransferase [Pseudomonadota bacterium]